MWPKPCDPVRIREAASGGSFLGSASTAPLHRIGRRDGEDDGHQHPEWRLRRMDRGGTGGDEGARHGAQACRRQGGSEGGRGGPGLPGQDRRDAGVRPGNRRTRARDRDRAAPELAVKTWYGMPAYAKDGKVVCFFKPAEKFKARYATLGFSDTAALDDGTMWPTEFALTELTAADETRIKGLVRKAVA